MTITPKPEQEQLIAQAIKAGLIRNADEALDIAVDTLRGRLRASAKPVNAQEWMQKFRAWAHSHSTTMPLLSDEAISRESIYRERGQ
jgi:hypothetical protein